MVWKKSLVVLAIAAAPAAMPGRADVPPADGAAVAAAWRHFLETADADQVYQAYSEVQQIEGEDGNVSAQGCRDHAETLQSAVETVPVSLTIQQLAYRCAEVLGDEVGAERHVQWFGALAKHALASAPPAEDWVAAPIRVVAGRDIYVLLEAMGLDFRYQSLEVVPRRRYLIVQVSAWDEEAKREHQLSFDFSDTYVRLMRSDDRARFPAFRKGYHEALIGEFANARQVMGLDVEAVKRAAGSADAAERVTLLRPIAEEGGVHATFNWLQTCVDEPYPGCGEGLVDALLPAAEKKHGTATVLLALAHAQGIGLKKKDERAAMALLDAADRITGKSGRAYVEYGRYLLSLDRPFTDGLRKRLDDSAAAGNTLATALLVAAAGEGPLPAGLREALEKAAEAGSGPATTALANLLLEEDDDGAATLRWLAAAAEAGDAYFQDIYATYLDEGRGVARDPALSLAWRQKAAAGGDTDAMDWLAWRALRDGDAKAAERWFVSGAMYGSNDAAFNLADLYLEGREGVEGDAARGVRILEELAEQGDDADARRRLAELYVLGEQVDKDPGRARGLLLRDAEKDDRESQTMLGLGLMRGDFGDVDRDGGEQWVQRAISAGYLSATDALAFHYFEHEGGEAGRRKGLALWRGALDAKDNDEVLNNLSWMLCTTPHADAYDPKAGGEVAARLEANEPRDSFHLDTLAACHAANGRYAQAVAMQEKAIERLRQFAPEDDEELAAMRERLQGYRSGVPYRDHDES